MTQSTLALIIVAIIVVLFATEKIPLWMTAVGGAFAMGFTGILSWNDVFAGCASTATTCIVGVAIVGASFFTTGVAGIIAKKLRVVSRNEKSFMGIMLIITTVISIFFNASTVIALMMPVIDAVSIGSDGPLDNKAIARKRTYIPMAVAAVYGATLTAFSATSNITTSGLLMDAGYGRGFNNFKPMLIMGPIMLVYLVYMFTIGHRVTAKVLNDVNEVPFPSATDTSKTGENVQTAGKGKLICFAVIILGLILALVFSPYNNTVCFVTAAIALILTGCIDAKFAIKSVSWETVLLIAGALGFAKGVQVSGAADVLSNFIVRLAGPLANSSYVMCMFMLILTAIISSIMSNNAATAIVMPMSMTIAKSLGGTELMLPFALACTIGTNLSVFTPICTPGITLTYSLGYRFKHYFKFGGIIFVAAVVISAIMFKVIYFM